jgi:hypothetical protein
LHLVYIQVREAGVFDVWASVLGWGGDYTGRAMLIPVVGDGKE